MRSLAAIIAALAVGCSPAPPAGPPTVWVVKLTRPDGKVHREFRVVSRNPPWPQSRENMTWLMDGDRWTSISGSPQEWFWDIDRAAESTSP